MKTFSKRSIVFFSMIFILSACNQGSLPYNGSLSQNTSASTGSSGSSGSGGNNSGSGSGGSVPPSGTASLAVPPAAQSVKLGASQTFMVTLHNPTSFSGQVVVMETSPSIQAADPKGAITYNISPSMINLAANSDVNISVTINASTMAPDLAANSAITLQVKSASDSSLIASADVSVVLDPTYEIHFLGGNVPESFSPDSKVTNFAHHANGVTVRFVNSDTKVEHYVHSQGGLIPHGSAFLPVATASADGGEYKVTVTDAVIKKAGTTQDMFWCHAHESATQVRVLNFNQP